MRRVAKMRIPVGLHRSTRLARESLKLSTQLDFTLEILMGFFKLMSAGTAFLPLPYCLSIYASL